MSTLALLELGPLVLTAIVTGAALGLAMPAVLGSKLDLRPYTGGFPVAIRLIDSGTAMLLAGGLAVIIGAAVAVDATVNARRRLTTVPRIGDQ
jgi:putative ABC transport system permease protein